MDSSGYASKRAHPLELGSKLTHPSITTDYAENLLEFITGVHGSTSDLFRELYQVHCFTSRTLGDEQLWTNSMPSILPGLDEDIPLAYFGESNVGKLKTLYRKGLGLRYGRSMQSIAGVHYNFSLTDNFWKLFQEQTKSELSLKEFKNTQYFNLIRNYRRYSWVLVYLFGASPLVDKSFLKDKKHNLERLSDDTFYTPYGTSLRMGGLGYTSSAQEEIGICFNKVETYIKTLEEARLSSYKGYEEIGLKSGDEYLQLNTHLLQIDNEFYSTIRPKNIAKTRESALGALHERGIEYIEVRLLDVDPFNELGITQETANFMHLFLIWCLMKNSPEIQGEECREIEANFNLIVTQGRRKDLELSQNGKKIQKIDYLKQVFGELETLTKQVDICDNTYSKAFETQFAKVNNEDLLPSNRLVSEVSSTVDKSYIKHQTKKSEEFKQKYNCNELSIKKFLELASGSVEEQKNIEAADKFGFDDFLVNYFEDIKINYGSLS